MFMMLMAKTGFSRDKISQARRAVAFIQPHKNKIAIILLIMLAVAALGALEPLIYKVAFDRLGTMSGVPQVLMAVGGIMAAAVVREGLSGLSNWLSWKVRLAVNYHLLDATTARLHALPLSYHRGTLPC